jgi:outer membrane protein
MFVRPRHLIAAFALMATAAPLVAQQKVAYVDSRRILQEMPARTQVEARIRTELAALEARQKKMVDSLQAMMGAFAKDSATMTPDVRNKRFAAMQAYDAEYRDTLQALEAEAQQKQGEAMQPLFDQIRLALEEVRVADGLSMIFDLGAQVNPIVAMDKNLDISDKVIARIRTMPAPRPGPTVPVTPAAAPTRPPAGPVQQPAGVSRRP